MDVISYLLGKKSGGGGGGTEPKIEVKNPLDTASKFILNITKVGDFTFNGTSLANFFDGFTSLVDVDLSKFDTTNVSEFKYMFYNCSSLIGLDLSSFNSSNIRISSMGGMFYGCTNLKKINLSNFNLPKGMSSGSGGSSVFANCSALEEIDIRNFEVSKISNGSLIDMFGSIPKSDCLIIVKDSTQKSTINNAVPRLTNVKTVEEYENSI